MHLSTELSHLWIIIREVNDLLRVLLNVKQPNVLHLTILSVELHAIKLRRVVAVNKIVNFQSWYLC